MKKILSFVFVLLFIVGSCLWLVACSNSTEKYERIELTTENYEKYISINLYYSDCQVELSTKTNEYGTYYNIICVGNIKTSKRANCSFEEVSISYSVRAFISKWSIIPTNITPYATIDYEGNSLCSFSTSIEDTTLLYIPYSSKSTITVSKIEGFALVPKESI